MKFGLAACELLDSKHQVIRPFAWAHSHLLLSQWKLIVCAQAWTTT